MARRVPGSSGCVGRDAAGVWAVVAANPAREGVPVTDVLEPACTTALSWLMWRGSVPSTVLAEIRALRRGLYQALQLAFSRARIRWDDCYREDRGDGVLILVPPQVPKTVLAAGVPGELAAAVRAHNQVHGRNAQMRLRVALHGGEVLHDAYGVTGRDDDIRR